MAGKPHNFKAGLKNNQRILAAAGAVLVVALLLLPGGVMGLDLSETSQEGEVPVQIEMGSGYICERTNWGNLRCETYLPWGNAAGQAEDYNGGDAVLLATGGWHTCILTDQQNVHCWGAEELDYTRGDAVEVSAGSDFTCILVETGDVHCWGRNNFGQTKGYDRGDAIAISAGATHACALLEDKTVTCWGSNGAGESEPYSLDVLGDVIQVSAGSWYTCVLAGMGEVGRVHCWGLNDWGQANDYLVPDAVKIATNTNGYHTCVSTVGGNVHCWGRGSSVNYIGIGEDAPLDVAVIDYETCILTKGHEVNCL